MEIKAADVMKLRKMTGAGMMDCKKALQEAEGDYARAQDIIREKGKLIVAKRADRSATEGVVVTKIVGQKAYLLCLACETDFVAQNAEYAASANAMLEVAVKNDAADRDALLPRHFAAWVRFAKERGLGLDFNPTFFSHPMAASGLTLSSPDDNVREFWIRHGIACLRISEYFARETGKKCLMNIWIPDGYKDTPADRQGPRRRFAESLDRILGAGYDRDLVAVSLESKVFGIGVESYTVGSAEFCLEYSAKHGLVPLMDNGHYHPTEVVSDKIPALLAFFPEIALHVTRPVRWDSDHVVLFDDETREIAKEIVRNGATKRVYIALDYFDASINRISAWATGARNMQKALLYALLSPNAELKALQDAGNYTKLMVLQEEVKTLPFGDIWREYCLRQGVKACDWFEEVEAYEKKVLANRK